MEKENTYSLENTYLPEEVKVIEELKAFGIYEPIAIDCMSSRTLEEMEIVLTFLRRYSHMISVKKQNNKNMIWDKELGIYKLPKQIEQIGVSKETLFKSWVEELGYDKAVLLSCNYDVKKVVEMSQEDAESEVQAIGD